MGFLWFGRRRQEPAPARPVRRTVSGDDIAVIRELRRDGMTLRAIASELGLSLGIVAKYARGTEADDDTLGELDELDKKIARIVAVNKRLTRLGVGSAEPGVVGVLLSQLPDLKAPVTLAAAAMARQAGLADGFIATVLGMNSVPVVGVSTPAQPTTLPSAPAPGGLPAAGGSLSDQLVDMVDGKSPAEVADMIVGIPDTGFQTLARGLATAPDPVAWLASEVVPQNPGLAGFVGWAAVRPDWLPAVAAALRERLAEQPAVANQPSRSGL